MHLRRFVLVPLADIAPEAVHPNLKKTVKQLLAETPDRSTVRQAGRGTIYRALRLRQIKTRQLVRLQEQTVRVMFGLEGVEPRFERAGLL